MAGLGIGAVLFVWAVGALLGGGDTPVVRGAANVRPDGVPLASAAPASDPPTSGRLAIPAGASSSASPSATAPATAAPASATVTTTPPVTTTTAPPGPPRTCPDPVMRVTVTTGAPSYQVGDQPTLTLHITNAGKVACIRDVSHQLRSINVLSANGTSTLWSSSYCYTVHTDEIRTLQPNESLSYSVVWAGRTAAPGCPTNRTTVPAGKYELVGRLGTLAGTPTVLTLTSGG